MDSKASNKITATDSQSGSATVRTDVEAEASTTARMDSPGQELSDESEFTKAHGRPTSRISTMNFQVNPLFRSPVLWCDR